MNDDQPLHMNKLALNFLKKSFALTKCFVFFSFRSFENAGENMKDCRMKLRRLNPEVYNPVLLQV